MKDLIVVIILAILLFILYKLINEGENNNIDKSKCNLENFDIDDMYIIKRGREYEKYIDKLIDKNKKMFSDEDLKILKNKFQFYNIKDRENIKNISNYMSLTVKLIIIICFIYYYIIFLAKFVAIIS
jgi:hypothetical protein